MPVVPSLMPTEWALGLFRYVNAHPLGEMFVEFFNLAEKLFTEADVEPTYVSAIAPKFPSKSIAYRDSRFRQLRNSRFDGVSMLSLVANPIGSGTPFYDRFINIGLTYNSPEEVMLSIGVNDGLIQFRIPRFREILMRLCRWQSWSFGFGLDDTISNRPDFHVLSLQREGLSSEEEKALLHWYNACPEERRSRIRAVYELNLINRDQLRQKGSNGETLEAYILSHDPKGSRLDN